MAQDFRNNAQLTGPSADRRSDDRDKYLPVANYGVIGNMHTVALVGCNGSLDWYCYPHFDSPSIFARILDFARGGYFHIHPVCDGHPITNKQMYFPETNVLVTRFLLRDGIIEV